MSAVSNTPNQLVPSHQTDEKVIQRWTLQNGLEVQLLQLNETLRCQALQPDPMNVCANKIHRLIFMDDEMSSEQNISKRLHFAFSRQPHVLLNHAQIPKGVSFYIAQQTPHSDISPPDQIDPVLAHFMEGKNLSEVCLATIELCILERLKENSDNSYSITNLTISRTVVDFTQITKTQGSPYLHEAIIVNIKRGILANVGCTIWGFIEGIFRSKNALNEKYHSTLAKETKTALFGSERLNGAQLERAKADFIKAYQRCDTINIYVSTDRTKCLLTLNNDSSSIPSKSASVGDQVGNVLLFVPLGFKMYNYWSGRQSGKVDNIFDGVASALSTSRNSNFVSIASSNSSKNSLNLLQNVGIASQSTPLETHTEEK